MTHTWFHFQKIFVILAFNKELFEGAVSLLVQIPVLGKEKTMFETLGFCDVKANYVVNIAGARLEGPVRKLLAQQREKLHSKGEGEQVLTKPNKIAKAGRPVGFGEISTTPSQNGQISTDFYFFNCSCFFYKILC